MKNLLYYTIAILFLAATACCHKKPKDSPTLQRVSATKVKCTHAMREYEANIISANSQNISFATKGTIDKINVSEGQSVQKGTVMANLKDETIKTKYDSLKKLHTELNFKLKRQEKLLRIGELTQKEYDKTEKDFNNLKEQYNLTASAFSATQLVAPYAGEIEKIHVTAGQLVSPNQTILKLADTTQQMIQFNAFEEDANKLLTSDSLIVTFNTDPTTHYSLKIAKIIKDDNHHISVSATIDTIQHRKYSRKPAGQTKGIVTDAANGSYNHFFIPTASIYVDKKKKETSVWVVDVKTQTISRRKVICSKKSKSGLTEIYKGVKENEMVIDTQYKSLKEGQKVMIKP